MWNISTILGSMIINDARCTREIESRIVMAKSVFSKKKAEMCAVLGYYTA
jgi:hypothetical protein